MAGLALRLLRELKMNVVNVAVTLGSRADRQAERWQELKNCCDYIGFGLVSTGERGLEGINPAARKKDARRWAIVGRGDRQDFVRASAFDHFLSARRRLEPDSPRSSSSARRGVGRVRFGMPDGRDGILGRDGHAQLDGGVSAADVADLVAALSLHVGEVARNPYHLRLPAWMIDNVRRGAELVGGQGGAAPEFAFATLYRLRRWENGEFHNLFDGGRVLASQDDLRKLFQPRLDKLMEVIIRTDPDAVAELTCRLITGRLNAKPDLVLGLATGRTMERVYERLVAKHKSDGLDFSRCHTFNLDEYIGVPPEDEHSYRFYMNHHLFQPGKYRPRQHPCA